MNRTARQAFVAFTTVLAGSLAPWTPSRRSAQSGRQLPAKASTGRGNALRHWPSGTGWRSGFSSSDVWTVSRRTGLTRCGVNVIRAVKPGIAQSVCAGPARDRKGPGEPRLGSRWRNCTTASIGGGTTGPISKRRSSVPSKLAAVPRHFWPGPSATSLARIWSARWRRSVRKFAEWVEAPAVVVTMWPDSPGLCRATGFAGVLCTDVYPFFSAGIRMVQTRRPHRARGIAVTPDSPPGR